ncbi:TRAP transporter large permease [Rhizobiales bacterium L72]|uniref:TRAP transporter large permease protein n=2 Tax=Propylenella binzhouense TaxID=2555902 RepID=A0A964WTF3_9HYPH|nr:TRAP transporter large permease [Propylenella binzhouense]MYZ47944.1 TRAP transporter large permease [Propylenella binzhouense]
MLVLMAIRMPVGLAMLVVGAGGYAWLAGPLALMNLVKTTPYYLFSNYTLSVIPLFILMGAFAERSGMSRALFSAANMLVGHFRGGIAMATIVASTLFGAICGSSVATTATMSRAALPAFKEYGYADRLATGTCAVGGTLGILIPPSVILVIYAISTEQNIAKLFMAAMIPGLMAAAFYLVTIRLLVARDPTLGPAADPVGTKAKLEAIAAVWPVLLIAAAVVGGIYGGIFTPTEGASVGAAGTLLVGIVRRTLGWKEIRESLIQTAGTSGMIFLILLGAEFFNGFLGLSQLPTAAAEWIAGLGLPAYGVLAVLLLFYILLGAVMDEMAMILLTLPVFFPIVSALDFGLTGEETAIWFGILVLVVVGIGLTAPPVGLNVFVVSALARDVPITRIYRGALPFLATDVVRLSVLVLFPGLSLALVRLLS